MSLAKDGKAIYGVVLKKSVKSYFKYIILVPLIFLYISVLLFVKLTLIFTIGQLGDGGMFLANTISWFISAMIISDFLGHMDTVISNQKIRLKSIASHKMTYFLPVLTATAVPIIIAEMIARLFDVDIPMSFILMFYIIYAVPEVIHQKNKEHLDIFSYGHEFIKENWHLWFWINMAFGFGLYWIVQLLVNPVANSVFPMDIFRSLTLFDLYFSILKFALVSAAILSVPLTFVLIFRGYLFKILSVSSKRKREYMRNTYGE